MSGGNGKLVLSPRKPFQGELRNGDSIACNGCCLTLERVLGDGSFEFHVMEETLRRTNLGSLPLGAAVNMERSMRVGGRLDGHIVTGHIDGTGRFLGTRRRGADLEAWIELPEVLKPYMISKGCIAIDGISLTPVEVTADSFSVHLIPLTTDETALTERKTGDLINLESDLLAKYVRHQLALMGYGEKSTVTMDTLLNAGW
jgi:riboflavin synthase